MGVGLQFDTFRKSIDAPHFWEALVSQLPDFLRQRRWFGGKSRRIRATTVLDIVPFEIAEVQAFLAAVRIEYSSGPSETYSVPLVRGDTGSAVAPQSGSLTVQIDGEAQPLVLYDAVADQQFLDSLIDVVANGQTLSGNKGAIRATATSALPSYWQPSEPRLPAKLMKGEQSNSSIIYGDRLILKLFRRLEEGINPDVEIGAFLTESAHFPHVPAVAGYMDYERTGRQPSSFAILQAFVPNQGDAWRFTLDAVREYYDQEKRNPIEPGELLDLSTGSVEQQVPRQAEQHVGDYLHWARLLGQRTAELHLALASVDDDPEFSPEPFAASDREEFCNSALDLLGRTFQLLQEQTHALPGPIQVNAEKTLQLEHAARQEFQSFLQTELTAKRTRIHGDYHLGQVLFTGDDFVIIDFEGEPARSLAERRTKRSPLQDVAGMLRSFHYAAYAPIIGDRSEGDGRDFGLAARYWYGCIAPTFLKAYFETSRGTSFLPASNAETQKLLDAYTLDKAIYELGYELNNRPAWVGIPLQGISDLLADRVISHRK